MNTSYVWNIQQCANQLLELLWPTLSFFTHQNECNLLLRPLHVQHNYIITCVCSQFRCLFSWQTDCDFTILQNGCVRKKLTNCIDHLTNLFNSYNRCTTYRVLMYALEWWTSYFSEKNSCSTLLLQVIINEMGRVAAGLEYLNLSLDCVH